MSRPKFYRDWVARGGLFRFELKVFETDILVCCDRPLAKEAEAVIRSARGEILDYISREGSFRDSLKPVAMDKSAPKIVRDMMERSAAAGVGPMAGVAGAIAEYTGRVLLEASSEVIVENGGDIFIKSSEERKLSVYAGDSPLSGKIGLVIRPERTPLGVCTSSGTVGHSKSFGAADAATVIAEDAILADCVATQAGNLAKKASDLERPIDYAKSVKGVRGALIIFGDKLAVWGEAELV